MFGPPQCTWGAGPVTPASLWSPERPEGGRGRGSQPRACGNHGGGAEGQALASSPEGGTRGSGQPGGGDSGPAVGMETGPGDSEAWVPIRGDVGVYEERAVGLCLHRCYPHSADEETEAQEGPEAHLVSPNREGGVRASSQGPSDTVTERDRVTRVKTQRRVHED